MKTLEPDVKEAMASPYARPRMLAVFHFAAGDLCVSESPAAPSGGPTFEPLVVSWGPISTSYRGPSGLKMPEASMKVANTGYTPFSAMLESCTPEETEVELFLWLEGHAYSARLPLGRFVISSPVRYDADYAELTLKCSVVRRNRVVGRVISRDEFPGADPDAVGRIANIIYGSVQGAACHAVAAGAATSLSADIDATQTTGISLSLAPGETPFPVSGTLQAGREIISYAGITDKTLTGVTRGVSGTAACSHKKGETVFEVRQSYEYLVADHPVRALGDVYVGGVRVTSGVTRLTDDGGKAKLVFSDKFTLEKAVDLDVDEGSHEHSGTLWAGTGSRTSTSRWTASENPGWTADEHTGRAFRDQAGNYFYIKANGQSYLDLASIHGAAVATGSYEGAIIRTHVEALYQDTVSSYFNAPATGSLSSLCDHNWNDFCSIQVTSGYINTTRSASVHDKGIIIGAKLCGTFGNSGSATGVGARSEFEGGPFNGQYVSGGGPSVATVRTADTISKGSACSWSDFTNTVLKASYTGSTNAGAFWEHWVEVTYIPYSGGTSPASGVSLKGDSAADFLVGGIVTCDVEGHADDAYGSFTGTAGALITNPADVVRHFMQQYLELPAEEFDATFESARYALSEMIPGGYTLSGVVDRPSDGFEIVEALSHQSRLSLSHDGFSVCATILEAGTYLPARTITASMIKAGSLRVTRTGMEGVMNRLTIYYKKDLGSDITGYLEVADSSNSYPSTGDPVSVAVYGQRSPARPFMLGFVRETGMAIDLRDYYITRYKDVARCLSFTLFMDNMDIEPGDRLTFDLAQGWTTLSGALFEVETVSLIPGSATAASPDELEVRAREVR